MIFMLHVFHLLPGMESSSKSKRTIPRSRTAVTSLTNDQKINVEGSPRNKFVTCFGHIDEWHLDFHNTPFFHEEFHLGAWLRQPAEMIAAVFLDAGLEALRSIRHSKCGNGIQ